MSSNHSILWNDATLGHDKALIEYLVDNIVAGERVNGHYMRCTEKILRIIQTAEWQASYPQRTHVFSILCRSIEAVVEITFALHTQALELLYFNIASTGKHLKLNTSAGFDQKLRVVFKSIYKWNLPQDTADGIRILRNDVMHTGTIAGVSGAYTNPDDPEKLAQLFEDNKFNINQVHTDIQNRMHLARLFKLLMQDMLIRTLGLEQNDLAFNLSPPWRGELFGYSHEYRPDWLRE